MTQKIVLHPTKSDTEAPKAKHFEQVWEESESLFKADDLNVDSVLNELQAKVSLYRMLGTGSFEAQDLERTKTLLVGKILMAVSKLSLKENLNTFIALQQAVADHKLMQMEMNASGGSLDKIIEALQSKAPQAKSRRTGMTEMTSELLKDALEQLTKAANSTS